ncbi:MAG: galactose mutarotase [Rikenellaceae bacterium]|jgi:aldose 1-epimerase|nr:galactose mutarotase [Rikenellaceae bacterium]
MDIEQQVWGFTPEGEAVILYTMTNASGAYVKLTNLGATIVAVGVPDRAGKIADVALGYNNFTDYAFDGNYFGKTVGRFANRIAEGRFTLDGKTYRVAVNNGRNHLHGGIKNFGEVIWEGRVEKNRVVFGYVSPDGDEGYPANLGVEVIYDWSNDCELEITYLAKSDAPTLVNLTNHVYFNLSGEGSGDILSQVLQMNASRYLPTDDGSIPLGEPAPVAGTPMDFTSPKPIGRDIDSTDFEQIRFGSGYDHFWVIDGWEPGKLVQAARVSDPASGRRLEVLTTQPGFMFYSGNHLGGSGHTKSGVPVAPRSGYAIECQYYPDSPNRPEYPSVVLNPDDTYEQHILFRFGVSE